MSAGEKQRLTRRFTSQISYVLGHQPRHPRART